MNDVSRSKLADVDHCGASERTVAMSSVESGIAALTRGELRAALHGTTGKIGL